MKNKKYFQWSSPLIQYWLYILSAFAIVAFFYFSIFSYRIDLVGAQPNTNTTSVWATNGTVYDIAIGNDGTVYMGGNFSYVGPYTGYGLPLAKATGTPNATYPKLNKASGSGAVEVVISDGADGWYVGGNFDTADAVSSSAIFRLNSDGAVDDTFSVEIEGGDKVNALFLYGGLLYIGGNFSTVNGVNRESLVAVNPTTGVLDAWDPNFNDSSVVYDMDTDGTDMFVVGQFSTIDGSTRNGGAAIALADASLQSWDPDFGFSNVYTVEVATNTVFVGGAYFTVGGDFNYAYLHEFDTTTGTPTDWDPNAGGTIRDIEIVNGKMYVVGEFNTIAGTNIGGAISLSPTTASATEWRPYPNSFVRDMYIDGEDIYLAGSFTSVTGTPRRYMARVNAATGTLDADFNPSFSSNVTAVAVSGTQMYVGGGFTLVNGEERADIAAFSSSTGRATAWNPNPNNDVYSILPDGDTIYVGGKFSSIGGESRNRLAAIDASDGAATAWNPNVGGGFGRGVSTMALDGNTLYIGGDFNQIGPDTRDFLGAVSTVTGSSTDWNPGLGGAFDGVRDIELTTNTVFVGGDFTSVGGDDKNLVAEISKATGSSTAWDAGLVDSGGFGSVVGAIELTSDTAYVGGLFTSAGGDDRDGLAALNLTTGSTTAFDAGDISFGFGGVDPQVSFLKVNNSILYLSGNFTAVAGTNRGGVAALNATTGAIESWYPEFSASFGTTVYDLEFSGSTVYAGGGFTSIGSNATAYYAQFGPVNIEFTSSTFSQSEATANATLNIEITSGNTTTEDITFTLDITGGTATNVTDYTVTTGTFTIIAGETSTSTQLTIVNDAVDEGDETIIFTLSSPSFADLGTQSTYTYTISNDDAAAPGVTITESDESTDITEGGDIDSYTIVLDAEPAANVIVTITGDADTSVSTSSIIFTAANWDTAVTVTTTATDDDIAEGAHETTITHTAASADGDYNEIAINDVTASITDNDTVGVTVTESGGSTDITEGGATDTYTIVLDSEPTANVTITIVADDDATVSTSSVIFTAANWDTAITVTTTATDDEIVEGNHTATITQTAASGDANYDDIAVANITANVTDNDEASSESESSGGGGSGASTVFGSNTNARITKPQVTQGPSESVVLGVGESKQIMIEKQQHTITPEKADNNEVTVRLESEPQIFTIKRGSFVDADSNRDGKNDVRMTYFGLVGGKPRLEIVELASNQMVVVINGGEAVTSKKEVTLLIRAESVQSIALSNVGNFAAASLVPFKNTVSWNLSDGFGEKTVYVRLKFTDGTIADLSDTITYVESDVVLPECSLETKRPYKHAGHPGVYYVTENCTKKAFKSARTYFSYFSSFDEVRTVQKATLDAIADDTIIFMPLGARAELKDGSLVKTITNPSVFFLLNGKKHRIASEGAFEALRFAWNMIQDVSADFLFKYSEGQEITEQEPIKDGTYLKYDGSPDVFQQVAGQEVKVETIQELLDDNYREDRIIRLPTR